MKMLLAKEKPRPLHLLLKTVVWGNPILSLFISVIFQKEEFEI